MAKLIILEGLSRTGKTSISNALKDEGYGRIVSVKDKMPQCKDLTSFYKGCFYAYDAFLESFDDETFVLDRSFLSEMVYPSFYKRSASIDLKYIIDFVKRNEIHLFLLTNTHEDYMKRKPKDSYVYSSEDYSLLEFLFHQKLSIVERYINNTTINTSSNSITESIDIIKSKLWKTEKSQSLQDQQA